MAKVSANAKVSTIMREKGLTLPQLQIALKNMELKEGSLVARKDVEWALMAKDRSLAALLAAHEFDLRPGQIRLWLPRDLRGGSFVINTELTDAQRSFIEGTITIVQAAEIQRDRDLAALAKWQLPTDDYLNAVLKGQKPKHGDREFVYIGICEHEVTTGENEWRRRRDSHNRRVPAFHRLCRNCSNKRAVLIGKFPGAATADSTCTVCKEPTFARGEAGMFASRRDVWENFLSAIYEPWRLPMKVGPNHGPNHPRHKEIDARNAELALYVDFLRVSLDTKLTQNPALADQLEKLEEAARKSITARAERLGLEDIDPNDYI